MSLGILVPIVAIACGPIAWMFTTSVRARHGCPIANGEGELLGRDGPLATNRSIALLAAENGDLNGGLLRLGERIAVLGRGATDATVRLEHGIDALR